MIKQKNNKPGLFDKLEAIRDNIRESRDNVMRSFFSGSYELAPRELERKKVFRRKIY